MSFSFKSIAIVVATIAIPSIFILLHAPVWFNIGLAIVAGALRVATDHIVFGPFLSKHPVGEFRITPVYLLVNSILFVGSCLGLYFLSRPMTTAQAIGAVFCSQSLIEGTAHLTRSLARKLRCYGGTD
jgi:hypothetical protein